MTQSYDSGALVTLSTLVTLNSVPTAPTAISLLVQRPDGTAVTYPSPTNDSVGAYHVDVPTTVSGTYSYRWVSTGTVSVVEGVFYVRPSLIGSISVVSPFEVRAFLRMPDTATTDDGTLSQFVAAAIAVCEDVVGPITPRTVTETYSGGSMTIVPAYRVVSITSLTEFIGLTAFTLTEQPLSNPGAFNGYGYTWDRATGEIVRRSAGGAQAYADGTDNITLTYVAGMPTVPPNIKQAVLELVRYWWQFGQAANAPVYGAPADGQTGPLMGSGALTSRVQSLLQPNRRGPGIA